MLKTNVIKVAYYNVVDSIQLVEKIKYQSEKLITCRNICLQTIQSRYIY